MHTILCVHVISSPVDLCMGESQEKKGRRLDGNRKAVEKFVFRCRMCTQAKISSLRQGRQSFKVFFVIMNGIIWERNLMASTARDLVLIHLNLKG